MPPWAPPMRRSCASSGRAWRLRAAWPSQEKRSAHCVPSHCWGSSEPSPQISPDLAGSRRISPDLAAVGAWHHPGPPNYPEVTCGVLIINAPRFASAAWAIVGPLLPQATRDKVSVLSPALILAP
jgi:hypothetical protein